MSSTLVNNGDEVTLGTLTSSTSPRITTTNKRLDKGNLKSKYSSNTDGIVKFTYTLDSGVKSEYLKWSQNGWIDGQENEWEAAKLVAEAAQPPVEAATVAMPLAVPPVALPPVALPPVAIPPVAIPPVAIPSVAIPPVAILPEATRLVALPPDDATEVALVALSPAEADARMNRRLQDSESMRSGLQRPVRTGDEKTTMLKNLKKLLDKVFPNEIATSSVPPTSCTDVLLIEQGSLDWLKAVVMQSPKPSSSDSIDAAEKATILQELWDVLPFNELELVNVYDLVRKSDFFTTLHNEQSFVQIILAFSRISIANYVFSRKTISGKENSFHRLEVVKNGSKWVLNIDIDVSEEKITSMGEDPDTFKDIVIQTFSFQNNNKVLTTSSDVESYSDLPTDVLNSLQKLRDLTDISASVTTIPFGIEHIEQKNLLVHGKLNQHKIRALADFFGDNWYIEERPSIVFTRESNYFGLKLVGDEATGIYIGINIHWGSLSTLVRCEIFWIPSKHLLQIFGNSEIYKKNDNTLDMERIYDEFVSNKKKVIFDKVTEGLNTYMTKHLIPYTSSSTGGKKQHKRSRKVSQKNLTRQTRKH